MSDPVRNAAGPRPVTIVVPIYDDLPTLTSCIESLKHNVDLKRNRVLLVNDCGPHADIIEESLLTQIKGCSSIRYERNERNLGFVGTCNRAVTELDTTDNDILLLNSDTVTTPGFLVELSAVLHLSPIHGIVCARSNMAAHASFPLTLRDPSAGHESARAAQVHGALSRIVRKYSIAPVAVGFCFLIRRELITQHGLFDDVFSPGYYEEYDFCLRMNEFGYSSVIANRAMVYHACGKSFVGEKAYTAVFEHQKVLEQRHPFFPRIMQTYMLLDRDPVDVFADVLVPADEVRRVILDIDVVPVAGLPDDTRAMLARLEKASDPNRLVVSLSISDDQRDRIAAQYPWLRVISHSQLDRWWEATHAVWDLAIASADVVSRNQLIRLNRLSPRWVFTSTGLDAVRSWRARAADLSTTALVQDAIGHADGVIALRTGLAAGLESYVGSAILRLPADGIVEIEGLNAKAVRELLERYGRSVIDIERLRARWDHFARLHYYECPVSESFIRPVIRHIELIAPRLIGYANGFVRKLRSRASSKKGREGRRPLFFGAGDRA
jgi:GT2 family glycosyltransferase